MHTTAAPASPALADASQTSSTSGRSTSWRRPRPNRGLMRLLGAFNRWMLHGVPLLRSIPGLRDLPFIRGYFRVHRIELSALDRRRLAGAVNFETAAFLAPNHPEFATDWLIDKELSMQVAPRMASWADRGIVSLAPRFWGANNLVSNDGGSEAKEYSIESAIAGDGVLLHPEGSVHWTNDVVHPLFAGVAQMAVAAARRTDRPVYIVPVVWKYHFVGDVSRGLHREMDAIERGLDLIPMDGLPVTERFRVLQYSVLALRMATFGFRVPLDADFFERQHLLREYLLGQLAARYPSDPLESIERRMSRMRRTIHRAQRALADHPRDAHTEARHRELELDAARVDEVLRLGEMTREVYGGETLTQEQISECLKRTRDRLLRRGLRNWLSVMLPRPAGARVVHVAVPEPIRVRRVESYDVRAYEQELLDEARRAMQQALDAINARIAPEVDRYRHVNALAAPAA